MAQSTATPRPHSANPVTPPSDWGITLGPLQKQAGRGGTSRSQANNTSTGNTSNDATVVFAVVDRKAEQRGLYWNNTRKAIEARSLLVEELFKVPHHVETVKQQLQALVVENRRVCGSETPDALGVYMGFDAYPGKSDKAVTVAGILLRKAATIQGLLGDPACEQMLQWICDQWRVHVDIHKEQPAPKTVGEIAQEIDADQLSESDYRSEEEDNDDEEANTVAPLKATPKTVPRSGAGHSDISTTASSIDSRMERSTASTSQQRKSHKRSVSDTSTLAPTTMNSMSATTATTTTTTTNTTITATTGVARKPRSPADLRDPTEKAAGAAAKVELQNADEILRRAQVQNDLMTAIDAGDGAKVLTILKTLPQPLHMLKYFPPPSVLRSYEKAQKWTYPFAEQHGLPELRQHISRAALAARTHAEITERIQRDTDMRKLYPIEVQNVCHALLACPENQVKAQAKALEIAIKQLMKSPHRKRLADLLAEQPFAGTKLLGFRCTLLEQHTKGKTVREFHKLVQQAHNLRAYAGEKLALELLNKGRNSPAVPALVRMVYALMMTASPGDYLLHRVSWDQAKEVREHVHAMHKKATSASAADQEQTWEATMLYALKWRVDTTMKKGPKTADSE